MLKSGEPDRLRRLTFLALLLGAAGSTALMLRAGGHNPSRLLVMLFGIWVLSPFLAGLLANLVSARWPAPIRVTVHLATLAVALGSLAVYEAYTLGRLRAKAGFVFLVVPFASWLLLAGAGVTVALLQRRAAKSARS